MLKKYHKDRKGGHPHIIFDENDTYITSMGLTTSPKKGDIKLEMNPLDNGKVSYMKPRATIDRKFMYDKKEKNGQMTLSDYSKAEKIVKKAKKKQSSQ